MKKYIWLGILAVIIIVVLWLVGYYNSFIGLNESVNTSWAQVENQYQRRYDLIPNLVETVKGYAAQEQTIFLGVTEARSKVGQVDMSKISDPAVFKQYQSAQQELSGALSRLLVGAENYPNLKSNENFLALQSQLEGTENRVATERMRYNEMVREYNVKAKGIPGKWFVGMAGLPGSRELFEAVTGANQVPQVKF